MEAKAELGGGGVAIGSEGSTTGSEGEDGACKKH